jgi:hypothetical protein
LLDRALAYIAGGLVGVPIGLGLLLHAETAPDV